MGIFKLLHSRPFNVYGVGVDSLYQDTKLAAHLTPIIKNSDELDIGESIGDEGLYPKLKPDFGANAVGHPPVPRVRHDVYEYYKLEFLPTGYPGKHHNGKIVPHPIYGSYLITDYLIQYEATNDTLYAEAAVNIGYETLKLMEHNEKYDALCFYYYEEDALTYYKGKFISGLTQARYLMPFLDLFHISQDEIFRKGAERILRSLKIPQSEGGVLVDTPFGVTVEEYPHEIPTFVLNGWTTIVLEILRYAKAVGNQEAQGFAEENIKTIEKLLYKYDFAELLTSRYQLTGFIYIKVICNKAKNVSLTSFATCVMEEWHDSKEGDANRWDNHILSRDIDKEGRLINRQGVLNAVFSQIDDTFKFNLGLNCDEDCEIKIYVANGEYDPALSSMPSRRWILLDEIKMKSGHTILKYELDKQNMRLLGYPTNFAKKIGKHNYNVYHWLHINNFLNIRKYYRSDIFEYFLTRWTQFVNEWKRVPIYENIEFSFENPSPPNESDSKNKLNRFKKDNQYRPVNVLLDKKFANIKQSGNITEVKPGKGGAFTTISDVSTDSYNYTCFFEKELSVGYYRLSVNIQKSLSEAELLIRVQAATSCGLIRYDVISDMSGKITRKSKGIISVSTLAETKTQFTIEMVFDVKKADKHSHRMFIYPAAAKRGKLSNTFKGSVGVGMIKVEQVYKMNA